MAFNALPATFTFDMWAHQYLQQSNEVNRDRGEREGRIEKEGRRETEKRDIE